MKYGNIQAPSLTGVKIWFLRPIRTNHKDLFIIMNSTFSTKTFLQSIVRDNVILLLKKIVKSSTNLSLFLNSSYEIYIFKLIKKIPKESYRHY